MKSLAPKGYSTTNNRIPTLDFLRGVAILGILFINIESFAYPNPWSSWQYGFFGKIDHDTRFWVYFLTQGKFYTMFALLFGVGFVIFIDRAQAKVRGVKAVDIYARRLFWLFFIGVFHVYFIWEGDILYHYAICGFLLLPFRSMKSKNIIITLLILLSIPIFESYENVSKRQQTYQKYQDALAKPTAALSKEEIELIASWDKRYSKKTAEREKLNAPKQSYWVGIKASYKHAQVRKGLFYYDSLIFSSLLVMLTGVLFYRSGIFTDYSVWKYYWVITLGLIMFGLLINYIRYEHWTYQDHEPVLEVWKSLAFTFPKEILGVAYVLLLNGLYQKFLKTWNLTLLTSVGRTALSNYILQSILLGILFYGYGFGLFNQVSRFELLAFVLGIWAVQITLTHIWLRFNKQGPLESIWRKLSYKPLTNN